EVLKLTKGNREDVDRDVEVVDMDLIRNAANSGRGTILLTAHFGNWELSSLVSSVEGWPIMVLVREQKMKRLNELLNRLRESNGCKVIRKGMDVKNILKALQEKKIVGILADQDAGKNGMFVDFFGRPTSSHSGTMEIAKRTDSIVLPNFIVRTKGPYHKLYLEEYIDFRNTPSKDAVRENLQRYMSLLERYVRQYPDQWLWLHKRWKSTPLRTVLVLNDGKAGHLNQSLAVAGQIQKARLSQGYKESDTKIVVVDVKFKNKFAKLALSLCARLANWRCQGCMLCMRACLTGQSYDTLMKTYADFVVSCGSATSAANVFMSKENNARNVIIMRPGIPGLKNFSLAVIPRHDKPPSRKNVVETTLAPNLIDGDTMRSKGAKIRQLVRIEKSIVLGLLVGGDNAGFMLTKDSTNKIVMGVLEFCKANDAEMLATTSRRTPSESESILKARLGNNRLCKLLVVANERNIEGAVAGILELSDIIAVSGESISMVSEAIASGKKVVVFELDKKTKAVTKYERVLADLERDGYLVRTTPAGLGAALERTWKKQFSGKGTNDREKIFAAVRRLI
ncbi:MAG: mitochondrial fission ELM1 family protein, partial [Candidatus Omnitrophica bacterium]|nr:mitochondrial fission ELM1 family protein [Candidatus Omnitrophota bacterium]